ncbi:MAG: hypothetical protein Q9159_002086 [Coniocarpon cinnabarinum]
MSDNLLAQHPFAETKGLKYLHTSALKPVRLAESQWPRPSLDDFSSDRLEAKRVIDSSRSSHGSSYGVKIMYRIHALADLHMMVLVGTGSLKLFPVAVAAALCDNHLLAGMHCQCSSSGTSTFNPSGSQPHAGAHRAQDSGLKHNRRESFTKGINECTATRPVGG